MYKFLQQPVLYYNGEPWVNKEGGSLDVTMGANAGVKVYEFVDIPL